MTNGVLRLTGMKFGLGIHGMVPHTEDELKGLLAQAVAQGTITKTRGQLLTSAFEFGQLKVKQIMTPRTQVDYLMLGQPIGEVLRIVRKSAYTRLPLCDKDIDHIVGLVHTKDLFHQLQLVPGKLKFVDEKSPEGLAIAIPTGRYAGILAVRAMIRVGGYRSEEDQAERAVCAGAIGGAAIAAAVSSRADAYGRGGG